MTTNTGEVLQQLGQDLQNRRIALAHLGTSSSAPTELTLGSPDSMRAYIEVMKPQIDTALAAVRWSERICVVSLLTILALTLWLSARAYFDRAGWKPEMLAVPGLGCVATWPILKLIALRRENLALRLLPTVLPLLSADDAGSVVMNFLAALKQ